MRQSLLAPAIAGMDDGAVAERIVVGFNWTAVQCGASVGLAWSPRGMAGAHTTPQTGSYAGRPLADLARLCLTDNPYERSIGLAAANAFWNRPTPSLQEGDGLTPWARDPEALREELAGTVIVGRFPGLDAKFPGATVVELDPRAGEVAYADAGPRFATARALVMTASTLVNGTAEAILAAVSPEARVSVVGPSVPLCPGLLTGPVRRLAGFVVTEPQAAFTAVMEGAGAKALKRFGRPVTLTAPQA
ncbi:Rossmann-like domain-containing protein [Thalassobaculum salexigens]|uniref:Rossmann-like domain-containing protein n=1 Tax=Thalassobaculum salexigens TaxID=455360 RepID=UPI00248D55AD|nr:DUF364 domain-containing protein [Thalassobaculum salexigens]